MKLKANLLGGSIFLILSIILWLLIPNQIPVSGNAIITSQTFPRLIVILMFAVVTVFVPYFLPFLNFLLKEY